MLEELFEDDDVISPTYIAIELLYDVNGEILYDVDGTAIYAIVG